MPEALKNPARRLVGARQVLRALSENRIEQVWIAQDADPIVTRPVMDACQRGGVRLTEVDNMVLLGKACAIDVKASVAGLLKE